MKAGYTKNQRLFILDAILINASIILTTGFFISGYMVFLKGSDFLTGIINSSVNWASIAALFSFLIYERMKRRKKLLLTLLACSRLLVGSVVFLPLFIREDQGIQYLAFAMIIAGNILWGAYSIGWTVWIMSEPPKETRYRFINARMLYLRISFTVATVLMGFVLDWFQKGYTGFLIVFCTALALSVMDFITLLNIEEHENPVGDSLRFNSAMFFEPLRNSKYRSFLVFVFLYYVSLTISSSYTPVFLIKYIRLDYGLVSTFNVIMYIGMIVSTKYWRRVEEQRGIEFVFRTTALLAITELLVYTFLVKEIYYLLFFSPVIAGIGYGGFNVCVYTHRYTLMPDEHKTVYEGWFGAAFGLSCLIAPFIGGILIESLPVIGGRVFRQGNFQLLYLVSFVLVMGVILFFFFGPRKYRIGESVPADVSLPGRMSLPGRTSEGQYTQKM